MREADPVAVPLEQLGVDRSFESRVCVGNDRAEALDRRIGAAATRRAAARARRRVSDATRDRSASCAPPAPAERARELERVERIAAARLVDAQKLGPRQRDVQLRANDAVDRRLVRAARRGGARREALRLELEPTAGPARDEDADGLAAQAAQRELEHGGGRRVEPLRVVDRRRAPAPTPRARAARRGPRGRSRAGRADGRANPRAGARPRARAASAREAPASVSGRTSSSRSPSAAYDSCTSPPAGRLTRTRYERACAASTAGVPKRRLADPRLALEHERARPVGDARDESRSASTRDRRFSTRTACITLCNG